MNGDKFLADTNAFIYLLNRASILQPFIDSIWVYTFITEIELPGKPGLKKSEENLVREMLSSAEKLQHQDPITELTILLKQKFRMKLPDAIIAASAQFLNLPLLTADKDFTRITDLDIILLEID